jgi:hypothetical protein
MKIYVSMLYLLFVGMSTTYCMNQPPKKLRHLDWKAHIREIDQNRTTFFSDEEYEGTLDQILDYGVDRYENKKNRKLSEEDREKKKKELLNHVRRG